MIHLAVLRQPVDEVADRRLKLRDAVIHRHGFFEILKAIHTRWGENTPAGLHSRTDRRRKWPCRCTCCLLAANRYGAAEPSRFACAPTTTRMLHSPSTKHVRQQAAFNLVDSIADDMNWEEARSLRAVAITCLEVFSGGRFSG